MAQAPSLSASGSHLVIMLMAGTMEGTRGMNVSIPAGCTCAPESLSLSEAPLPLPAPARPTRLPREAEPSSPDRRHGATGGYLAAPSGSGTRSRSASRGSATSRGVELQEVASDLNKT